MRDFGVDKKRYLFMIPLLLLAIVATALIRAPRMAVARFRPGASAHASPLMGWALDAAIDPDAATVEHSLVYATLTWRDFEPEEGVYDFEAFEAKNHLQEWWRRGKALVLRFVMDVPGEEAHRDIPDWLYEQMGDSAGCAYENSLGKGFSPNYNSRFLRGRHELALLALGERYDRHAGFAFIEMGSLGHNGSWSVESVPDEWALPPADELLTWAWQYGAAFPNTSILMSAPYQPARLMGLGLYNDYLGDADNTWNWLDTIEYGGYDSAVGAELRAMPGALVSAPSGARIGKGVDQQALLGKGFASLMRQLSLSRTTYVSGLDIASVSGADTALSVSVSSMGYRLWVREARYPAAVRSDYRMRVQLDLRNSGVQAFSQNWPVELSLLREGEVVYTQTTDLDIRTITPGTHPVALSLDVPRGLTGTFDLALSILHPESRQPAVPLCMEGARVGLRQVLGRLEITG